MKKVGLICPLLLALFILSGCVETFKKELFSNLQQENFDNMLARNNNKSYRLGNKILKKEFNDSVKLAMGEYMDSVKLFVNWKAKIKNIESREIGKSVALTFKLIYVPEQYRKVTFDVDYILSKDSLNFDKIYKTIKNLSDYSTVYFDGFIRKKENGEAYYSSYSDDLMHSYPDFKFFIVDINTISKGDTLSSNLKSAVNLGFRFMKNFELSFRKKHSKKETKKILNIITTEFKPVREKLTQEEKEYVDRYNTALLYNFLYAQ